MTKIYLLIFLPLVTGCAELQQIADNLPQERGITNTEIAQK